MKTDAVTDNTPFPAAEAVTSIGSISYRYVAKA